MPIRIRISLNILLFVVTRKVCRFSLILDPLKLFKKPVAVPLQVFAPLLKIFGKSLTIYFLEVHQKLVDRPVVPGCAGCAMADQLTLFQPGGTDYAHLITTGTPGFSGLRIIAKPRLHLYSQI